MSDQQLFRNEDLVLRVSPSIAPSRFDIERFDAFVDALCGTRDYQKDAIRATLRFFLSGRYPSLRALAEENFYSNLRIQDRYGTLTEMARHLQLPDQVSCSIDLATATGKSYVMYGIARIMLARGAVDQVLVLCPSRTIEAGLTAKFRQLSSDATLKELLPEDAVFAVPHIINGTESIVPGTICVENFHAVLEHTKSSIRDSLVGRGARTLVLNDEVHHVYNAMGREFKRWKEFLLLPEFGFNYIAGFSGTCYIGDAYFADVVSRYSLRQAIEQGFAKTIDYVAEDTTSSDDEKFQKIYDNHQGNRTLYRLVKPLSILVTRDIGTCKTLTADFIDFLAARQGVPVEDAARRVLIVTSADEHQNNVRRLGQVDRADDPVEWITSVSMLTEGWDVKNVFQIVPHEERAFNSKLLIAQVLGRGLRVPDAYKGERPVVTVFNHDAWSSRIKHLVDEVMEIEKRIYCYPVEKAPDYNFDLHHINYGKEQSVENFDQQGEYEFTKGYISLPLVSQLPIVERETTYVRAVTGERRLKRTKIRYRMFSVEEVAEQVHNRLRSIDLETATTSYAEKYHLDWLGQLIHNSLRRAGETHGIVSEENRQRIYSAFNVLHREANKVVRYRMVANALVTVNTRQRQRSSAGYASLRRSEATVFLDENSLSVSDEDTRRVLQEVLDDEQLPKTASQQVSNAYLFKTPLNVVIAEFKPERDFVRQLVKADNANTVNAWIKSTDQDFYPIEYAWRKGEHPKRGFFNPDFFINKGTHIVVVEVKGDEELDDPSDENNAKCRAARQHFERLNSQQDECIYHFHFLTPVDYDLFFGFLRDARYDFVSRLDASLDRNGN